MFGVPGHNHPSELRVRSNACAMEHLFVWREGRVLSTTTYGCAPTTSVAGDALARTGYAAPCQIILYRTQPSPFSCFLFCS